MKTIAQIQSGMRAFDEYARKTDDPTALQRKWDSLFRSELSKHSADAFVRYYRKMKQTKKQRGGVAPLDYTMTPGANVSVYGRFPVAIDTNQASIRDLDVYFQNALTADCGNPAQAAAFPSPSSEMGSNQVGGRRRNTRRNRRNATLRKNRKDRKGTKNRKDTRRRRNTYRARGGDLMTTLGYHPFLATAPPSLIQSGTNAWSGNPAPLPFPGSPVQHQWQYVSNGTAGVIDPGLVTPIGTNFGKLAGMDPYQTAQ